MVSNLVNLILVTFVASLFCGSCRATSTEGSGRRDGPLMYIVDGEDAPRAAWPWMTYMFGPRDLFSKGYICGAALISDQYVLTAAHCLFKFGKWHPNFSEGDLKLIFGKHSFSGRDVSEFWLSAAEHIEHPGFMTDNEMPNFMPSYDIALVRLARKMDLQGAQCKFQPISLPVKGQKLTYDECLVLGWGMTDPERLARPLDLVLQQTNVTVIPREECDYLYSTEGGVADEKMCIQDKKVMELEMHRRQKRNACNGDSGGPVQCRMDVHGTKTWVLVGVVSGGLLCGSPVHPVLSTRVDSVIDWINENISDD